MHPSFHSRGGGGGMTTRLTSSRSGSMSNASKKKELFKKSSEYYTRTTPACSSWTGGYGGGSWTPWPTSRRWGRPTFVALARAMATEGASQSDFVPVTTGDPCGCPVGQGLAPHQPTLSVSLLWAPSSAAGRCRHILLQHTMMNFMTYFALFGVFWNSIKNNSEWMVAGPGRAAVNNQQRDSKNWE